MSDARCYANQSAAVQFRIYMSLFLEEGLIMPDDETMATILAICDLIKHNGSGIETAVEAYQRAMRDVMEYRRSKGMTEVGGLPIGPGE